MLYSTNAHKIKDQDFVFGLDLQVPGHAGGWEPQHGQQDSDWSELRGPSPECAEGKNKWRFYNNNIKNDTSF